MTRAIVRMTLEDAEHYTPEQRLAIIAGYPAHERTARVEGLPALGEGHVFPIDEAEITIEPFPIPAHWPQINGLDFGWDHPTAAVNLAWDREADVVYVCKDYAAKKETPLVHAAALKPWGGWIPWAWPHDGKGTEKGTGLQLSQSYRDHGMNLLDEHATNPEGGNSVEAAIMEMLGRMQTGRWKVFSSCKGWLGEFKLYHRKNGQIVKLNDDRISASRYAHMMLRHAITKPMTSTGPLKRNLRGVVV